MLLMFAGKSRTPASWQSIGPPLPGSHLGSSSSSSDTTIHQEPSARAVVASTHWRQQERRCLERLHLCCWLQDNTRLWRLWWLSIYPGLQDTPHLGPEEAAHYSHTGAPLDNFTIILLVLMKATYKYLQEVRHCTRANTGNKQRAQCWSGQQPSSSAALLSTKHGI